MRQALLLLPLGAVLLCALQGCTSDRRATVSGKVTYLDKPLPGGTVVFVPEDKDKMGDRAPIQPDGTYTTSGVPFGKMKVAVEPGTKGGTGMPKGAKMPSSDKDEKKLPLQYSKDQPDTYVDIPGRYRNPATSGLSVDVDSSSKTYDIPLTK